MIKVAALTSGRDLPSSRYRIRQHIEPLFNNEIKVQEYCPAISKWAPVPAKPEGISNRAVLPIYALWQATKLLTRIPAVLGSYRNDIIWLNRELLPGYSTLEGLLKQPLVVDVDDAIWLTPPFGVRVAKKMADKAQVMIVGNNYLADWFGEFSNHVHVIPTAIDTTLFQPKRNELREDNTFTIGWIGSKGNLPYLEAIEYSLVRFFKDAPRARLLIISDRKPNFRLLSAQFVEYEPWSKATEVTAIQRMDIGLMPLEDSDWARGKCSFKMLQYMAMAIPVIVSPVGMNREVLELGNVGFSAATPNDWQEALEYCYLNREKSQQIGVAGRMIVEENFERLKISQKIAEVFMSL